MIINRERLLDLQPIEDMQSIKNRSHGVSWGLSEAGYDIRIKQEVKFIPDYYGSFNCHVRDGYDYQPPKKGRFTIASAIEKFQMPSTLVGKVHDKSTWARRGLSVFNTVIEPGWHGYLTLELVYHGNEVLIIPEGAGIAQVLFFSVAVPHEYSGKYQDQPDMPVPARRS
jgi:dCTP deaminase